MSSGVSDQGDMGRELPDSSQGGGVAQGGEAVGGFC